MSKQLNKKLKAAVISGSDANAEQALKVLRSDLCRLLFDYFDFDLRNFDFAADLMPDGRVSLNLSLDATGFKEAGRVLD